MKQNSKMKPYFSIIIPVYNAELTIKRCLSSILNQTFVNFECIIINDGSIDKTYIILEEYAKIDSRFIVINKENGGVSSARNFGLNIARGEYIVFIDSDDYIDDSYLLNFSLYKTDIIICGFESFGKIKKIGIPKLAEYNTNDKIRNLINLNFNEPYFKTPWGKAIHSKFFKDTNLRFRTDMIIGEDVEINLRIYSKITSIKCINFIGYYYYSNDSEKYILSCLQYKQHVSKIKNAFKTSSVFSKDVLLEEYKTFYSVFMYQIWNYPIIKAFKSALQFNIFCMYRYLPFRGLKRIRKSIAMLIIPFIRIINK